MLSRYLLRPLGLEIEYTNIKGRSDHIYLTFNQPAERQKLYHKIIVARQDQLSGQGQNLPKKANNSLIPSTELHLEKNEIEHPLSPKPGEETFHKMMSY